MSSYTKSRPIKKYNLDRIDTGFQDIVFMEGLADHPHFIKVNTSTITNDVVVADIDLMDGDLFNYIVQVDNDISYENMTLIIFQIVVILNIMRKSFIGHASFTLDNLLYRTQSPTEYGYLIDGTVYKITTPILIKVTDFETIRYKDMAWAPHISEDTRPMKICSQQKQDAVSIFDSLSLYLTRKYPSFIDLKSFLNVAAADAINDQLNYDQLLSDFVFRFGNVFVIDNGIVPVETRVISDWKNTQLYADYASRV